VNYNLLTYCIYTPIILFITIRVGWLFYKNGAVFLQKIFDNHSITKTINKLLLTGYYLVNIGYSVIMISFWEVVESVDGVVHSITTRTGIIMLFLAVLHYNNIIILKYIATKKILTK